MKQLQYSTHGGPDALHFATVPTPAPGRGEILVKVRAASINPTDTKKRTGELAAMNLFTPAPWGMGMDVAGVVEAVGTGTTGFAVGDFVVGLSKHGNAFADSTIVAASGALPIPDTLSFAEAACIPMGSTAVALRDLVKAKPRSRVLVNGAAGGIGLFFVQLLVESGVQVTATASASSLDVLRRVGVTAALDYRSDALAALTGTFDIVVDLSSKLSYSQAVPLLARRGRYYTLTPNASAFGSLIATVFTKKKARLAFAIASAKTARVILDHIAGDRMLVEVGAERPLDDAIAVMTALESGELKVPGKVVLTVDIFPL